MYYNVTKLLINIKSNILFIFKILSFINIYFNIYVWGKNKIIQQKIYKF